MATSARKREVLDDGATVYWTVTIDDVTMIVEGATRAKAIKAAQAELERQAQPLIDLAAGVERSAADNDAFLDIAEPSVEELRAQVLALTAQCSALTALLLGRDGA